MKIVLVHFVFDVYQQPRFSSPHPMKRNVGIRLVISAATRLHGFAFAFTNKILSIKSDLQKQFDLK